jgi:hypothetical protein
VRPQAVHSLFTCGLGGRTESVEAESKAGPRTQQHRCWFPESSCRLTPPWASLKAPKSSALGERSARARQCWSPGLLYHSTPRQASSNVRLNSASVERRLQARQRWSPGFLYHSTPHHPLSKAGKNWRRVIARRRRLECALRCRKPQPTPLRRSSSRGEPRGSGQGAGHARRCLSKPCWRIARRNRRVSGKTWLFL